MPDTVSELARRLAENAEAVCRHYLSNGRRHGRYWVVGDVQNTKGRSLYVRLVGPGSGPGAAGKWTDAATDEHGDLLDLIAAARGRPPLDAVLDEARRFLGLASQEPKPSCPASSGSLEAAQRLFAGSVPIAGTLADTYLHQRGIVDSGELSALRFHPRCFYRPEPGIADGAQTAWPALVAGVTDLGGEITGVQRTWLDPSGKGKAPVATPRRAMGHLLGHAVRFGAVAARRVGGRRGHRDRAVLAERPALLANGRRALGRSPRRAPTPTGSTPALHRPRQRPGRAWSGGQAGEQDTGGRDRGDRAGTEPGRLQRRSAAARTRCVVGHRARAARPGGRGPVLASAGAWRTEAVTMAPARDRGWVSATMARTGPESAPKAF